VDKDGLAAPQSTEELEQRIRNVLQEHNVPGAGVVLVTKKDVLWVVGIGEADRGTGTAVTPETRFRVGSVSKSFVSLAVLKLQEQGKLRLEDKLADVAPDVAFSNPWEDAEPLRLVHLLEHTAGLDDLQLCEFAMNEPAISLRDALAFHPQSRKLSWKPGRYFSYSNVGPSMAARAVEQATGQRFEEFVAEQFFAPLHMESASFFLPENIERTLAKGYGNNGKTEIPFSHIIMRPSGSVSATPRDVGRLVQLLLNRGTCSSGRLLRQESVERMEAPATTLAARHGLRTGYGLGNYTTAENGFLFHGHDGGIDGFLSGYAYAPEYGVGYFFAINAANYAAHQDIGKAIRGYLTSDQDPSETPVAAILSPDRQNEFIGYYEPITTFWERAHFLVRLLGVQRISASNGRLQVSGLVDGAKELIPVSTATFRAPDEPIASTVILEDGEGGHVLQGLGAPFPNSYLRVHALQVWAERGTAVFCLGLMLSAVFFALTWVPRWWFRRLHSVRGLSVRVLPLLAVLWLIGAFALLATTSGPPLLFERFGRLTPWSVGLCVLLWLFPFTAVVGLVQASRGPWLGVRRAVWLHALLVSAANTLVAAYLAYWGLGVRED
jgi:CubicO group peptidase (beta-lactamase class C family)